MDIKNMINTTTKVLSKVSKKNWIIVGASAVATLLSSCFIAKLFRKRSISNIIEDNEFLSEKLFIEGNGKKEVNDILDDKGFDYDWDSEGRLMVSAKNVSEIIAILEEYGYSAEWI